MIIYKKDNTIRATLHQSDDSDVRWDISGEEYATIRITTMEYISFETGDYVILYGQRFALYSIATPVEKRSSEHFVYTLRFDSLRRDLQNVNFVLFDNTTSGTEPEYVASTTYSIGDKAKYNNVVYQYINTTPAAGKTPAEGEWWTVVRTAPIWDFPIVLDPKRFAKMIVDNMNRARPNETWTVGYCIDHSPLQCTFSNTDCLEAATSIASAFETEFWVGNYTINFGKRADTTSLTMQYGAEGGFKGITRTEISNTKKVTRLVALGSERNLKGTYRNGSPRLMLPDAYYLDSANIDANNPLEEVVTWDSIYPCLEHAKEDYSASKTYTLGDQVLYNRISWDYIYATPSAGNIPATASSYWRMSEGSVTSMVSTLKFTDANLTFNPLDAAYAMSDGTQAKVAFLTGNLAGYELPIQSYDPLTKSITLGTIEDGTDNIIPAKDYTFAYGDQYFFVDIYMPQTYIDKAEQRLLAKANEYLAKYSYDTVAYKGDVSIIWATANAIELHIGDMITVVDTDYGVNDEFRIISLTRNITNPYKYTIELSQLPYIPSRIEDIENAVNDNNDYIDRNGSDKIMFRAHTYKGAKEALDMAFDPEGNYFTDKIKPLIVETSQVLVGTNTQQYQLTGLEFSTLSSNPNHVDWTAGTITDSSMESAPRAWNIAAGSFDADVDPLKSYYCYIVCTRATGSTVATILFDENKKTVKFDNTYYYFLLGTLGQKIDGVRQFWTSKGFTFISGDTIVTGRIKNTTGTVDIDLTNEEFNFGDTDKYIRYRDGILETQQLLIVSPGGDSSFAEIYVGDYSDTRQYYQGEYFDYTDGNQYICALQPPTPGILPTNVAYFRKRTEKGANGDYTSYVFKESLTQPATPTGTDVIPTGWLDAPNTNGTWWMSKATISGTTGLAGTWSTPIQVTGTTGAKGDKAIFKYAKNESMLTAPTISVSTLNPGAAWTLTPPILSTGEYLWMTSAIVNFDSTVLIVNWSTPTRISGEKGQNGLSAIAAVLTNSYHGVPTDASGNNGVFTNCVTTINLYVGGSIQTSGVTYSFVASDPAITFSVTGNTVNVLTLGVETGYITCTATYNSIAYSQVFKLAKIRAGASGQAGVSYWLNVNAEIIVKKTVGTTTTYVPSTLSFYPRKQVGTAEAIPSGTGTTFYMHGWNGSSWVELSSSPYANPSLYTYTTPTINGTYTKYRGLLYYGTVLLDEINVAMVEDAASAKDALAYQLGGFASYQDYVNYVSTYGRTLIEGGYINANLIDVQALVSDALLVQSMANIAGTYFETDGVTFTQQNGITLPATINSVATSLDINPQPLPDLSAFLTSSSLTGTTNLPALNTAIQDREPLDSPTTQATNGYMSIPAGVTSIKTNSITIGGSIQIENRAVGDRSGFVYKCAMLALFYSGTTFLSQVLIGNYSLDSPADFRTFSNTFSSVTLSVPNGATRVYLHSENTLYVKTNTGGNPYGLFIFNSVASGAYFYNATGVYRSRISPDGYALARDSSNYFHLKSGASKMLLSFMGDIDSNSIAQKLLTMSVAATGLIVNVGGYMKKTGFTVGSSITKVQTGVWRIQHDIKSNYNLGPSSYTIHLTIQNGGYNIPGFMYVSGYDTTNYNWTEVRCMNKDGVLIDTEFYVSFMRI